MTHHLTMVHARLGQLDSARHCADETFSTASSVGYGFIVARAKHMLARISLAEGDVDQACEWTRRSIATSWQLGHRRDALLHCRWPGFLLLQSQPDARALPLFAEGADELDNQVMLAATVMTLQERSDWEHALAELRSHLAGPVWAAAWRLAAASPPEQTLRDFGVL